MGARSLIGVDPMFKPGQLLIAHPNLPQRSIFSHSVILVTENTRKGTAGLILNKRSEHNVNDLLAPRGIDLGYIDLYQGGPVNPGALILVHSDEWYASNTMHVPDGYAITSDTHMLEKLSMGNRPDFYRLCLGMTGWMPGQLEKEIKDETWLTCSAEPAIIFEYEGDSQWRKALDLCAAQAVAQFF
jgi:putative transcriptional regulator